MKTVAIHQLGYIPWLPFLDKIKKSDVFVFLDDVQYQKNGWQNRNKIRTSDGTMWLTIPVKAHMNLKSNEIKIDYRFEPIRCQYCGNDYANKFNLQRHEKHVNEIILMTA